MEMGKDVLLKHCTNNHIAASFSDVDDWREQLVDALSCGQRTGTRSPMSEPLLTSATENLPAVVIK